MQVARVDRWADLGAALAGLGLRGPRPVAVLVGGAANVDAPTLARAEPALRRLAGVAEATGAAVVDGATDAGVVRLIGRARAGGASFPLVGVAVAALATEPGSRPGGEQAPLEPNHSHVLLVPGTRWGDEVPWLQRVADLVAGGAPSVTVLVDGGEIALEDVEESVASGRRVLVLAGSGRTADRVAAALAGGRAGDRLRKLVASGLVSAVELGEDTGAALARELETVLTAGR